LFLRLEYLNVSFPGSQKTAIFNKSKRDIMDIKSEKTALIKELEKINDEALIRAIQSLVDYASKRDQEYLGTTVDQYNDELDEADTQIEKGEFIVHEDAVKLVKGWRTQEK